MQPVYEPSDDTYLLLDAVKAYLSEQKVTGTTILDMGSGSGEIGFSLAGNEVAVTCVDVNNDAVAHMQQRKEKEEYADKKIAVVHSDLFDNIDLGTKFDYILFNTPYLPDEEDSDVHDIALHGGPNGNEVALAFLSQAKQYLSKTGRIFILVSSLGQPEEVKRYLDRNYNEYEIVARKKLFFEELLVYRISI